MINVNDLKLGNYFMDKQENILSVMGLSCDEGENAIWHGKELGEYVLPKEAKPIKLSGDILKRCGFAFGGKIKEAENQYFERYVLWNYIDKTKPEVHLIKAKIDGLSIDVNAFHFERRIYTRYRLEYLHELQNIIKAINGVDLVLQDAV